MMFLPVERLLRWWKNANARARWIASILVFSVLCTLALALLTGSPVTDPTYGAATVDTSPLYFMGVLLKLLFVLGLLIGAAVVYRHYMVKQPSRQTPRNLEIVETMRLSPRQALHLVRAGEQFLLVGVSDQGFSMLSEIHSPVLNANQPAPGDPSEAHTHAAAPIVFETILSKQLSSAKK